MKLINRNNFPPGGFPYREPAVNWSAPRDGLGFDLRVQQIQAVRIANPNAGLNPSLDACADALEIYTCTRLANDPAWCVPDESPVAKALAAARKAPRCGGCASRKRKRQ